MARTEPFDKYSEDYEKWFDKYDNIFQSELNAVRSFIPEGLKGIEVGVGTGKFALPLNIDTGVDPSESMLQIAKERGLNAYKVPAESLPLGDKEFDFVLIVTAICFFDDVPQALKEARRILKDDGFIVAAIIDRESELGKMYEKRKEDSRFYREANFYSVEEVTSFLKYAGFSNFEYRQTVFTLENTLQEVKDGYGEGGFVVVKAEA